MVAARLSGGDVVNHPDINEVWQWLAQVPDPEIPVISLVDLGIVRNVDYTEGRLRVTLSPTYSGCPATRVIEQDVRLALQMQGIDDVIIHQQISPPWTTDWMSEAGKTKLQAYGIAPPSAKGQPEACPVCGARDVSLVSQFGSTPCKAHWRCDTCRESFDYFKCI